jgi:hypothetical protein
VLRACRRVLRRNGKTAFHVISVPPGLSRGEQIRAVEIGPVHARVDGSYADLLIAAGFGGVEEFDITDQFRETIATWHFASAAAADELEQVYGVEEFRQSQLHHLRRLEAIDDGMLIRSLFVATAG